MRKRHLRARSHSDREDMIWIQRASIQGAEHILISEIVPEAEGEFRGIADFLAVGGNESFDDLSFVDECGPDLEVRFASHDFDVPLLAYRVLELFLAFAGHVGAKLGIGGAVMPG